MKDQRSQEQIKGQNGVCPTVTVKHPKGGTMVINAHEYDEAVHGKVIKAEKREAAGMTGADGGVKGSPDPVDIDWTKKTVPELKDHLAGKGVAIDSDARKDELVALCVANP